MEATIHGQGEEAITIATSKRFYPYLPCVGCQFTPKALKARYKQLEEHAEAGDRF
jgi:hypothetical protein